MVAAWMSADTGVGPSMASPSHDCSGTWADLPQAPSKSKRPIDVIVADDACGAPAATSAKLKLPNVANINMIAIESPKSPMRLTTKAFFAAVAADGLYDQNPISR